ncbi:MAG: response regulator, partial [Clostridiales Family XIII bacterium]|nr:response regulator [Clostridiales Family XIII bacterium]
MDLQKKTAKIVIFDDEIHICNLIQTLIDFDKLHLNLVGVAHNGVDALDILKRENPEIAICDIRMPGYDGIEVLKAAEELGSKTKFIIISGYREFEYAREGIKLGAVDYLLKPINKEELNSSILRALDEYGIADELGILSHELMTSKSMLREQFILDMKERRVDRTSFTIDNIHNRYSIDFAAEICALCLHVSSDTIHDQKMYDLILEKSTGNIEAQMSQLNADAIIFTIENNLIVLLSEDAGGDEISSLIFDILKLVEQPAGALAGSMVHLGRAQLVRNMQSVEDMQKNVEGVGAVENVDDVEGGVRKMVAIRGNRVEGVENIENVEGVDTVKDIDDVEGIGTVNDAKDVENVDTIENVEAIGTFKDVGDVVNADDVEDVGDVENTKDVEDVGDVEGGERKMVAIRGNRVEGVENIENIEGI